MPLFHDEDDHDPKEPQRGLPASLPEGEDILWQGRAHGKTLILHAFHIRTITIYLAVAAVIKGGLDVSQGTPMAQVLENVLTTALLAGIAVLILSLLGWHMAQKSLFTITNKRVVFRHGIAFRKYINLPFQEIVKVDMRRHASGYGDLALQISEKATVPYLHLWPFARPMRVNNTVPLIRAVDHVEDVGRLLIGAIARATDIDVNINAPIKGQVPAQTSSLLEPQAVLS